MNYCMLIRVNILLIRRHALFFLFLLMSISVLCGMEKKQMVHPSLWSLLPKDIIAKIFACTDLETKEKLLFGCPEMFVLEAKDLLVHSPLVLRREEHLYHMVHTAKNNDKYVFNNLFFNASHCDHVDALDTVRYFLPKNSYELDLLKKCLMLQDSSQLEQLLPYVMAVYKGDEKTIDQYLIKYMYFPEDEERMNPLSMAVHRRHSNGVVELLLTQNIDVLNMQDHNGWTPLCWAVYVKDLEMCKFLLSFKEIEVDTFDKDGNAALHLAVLENELPIVKLLLENGVSVNVSNNKRQTPLWCASCTGSVDVVSLLLAYKADIEITASDNEDPYDTINSLSVAILNGSMPIIRLLIEHGADLNVRAKGDDFTPLLFAVVNNNYDAAELLLQSGADVDAMDCEGYTALIWATDIGNFTIFKLLLTHGADINHCAYNGYSALDFALDDENEEIITCLLEQPGLMTSEEEERWIARFKNKRKKETGNIWLNFF